MGWLLLEKMKHASQGKKPYRAWTRLQPCGMGQRQAVKKSVKTEDAGGRNAHAPMYESLGYPLKDRIRNEYITGCFRAPDITDDSGSDWSGRFWGSVKGRRGRGKTKLSREQVVRTNMAPCGIDGILGKGLKGLKGCDSSTGPCHRRGKGLI